MSTVIGSLIFVLILFAGLTTIYTVFSYYNAYNAQLLQYNQSQLQREETSISITGFTFGSSANTIATSTSFSNAYVQVTLTNNAGSATPSTFQQQIVFDPASYQSAEASNLGNIRFCTSPSCSTMLYAWLQQCTSSCGTSATSATAWVKLTSSIGASGGTLTIYMVFESTSTNFDGNYWGEAPNLSGTYGQYDNGANVFTFYDNFASGTGKWTTNESSSGVTIQASNGLTIKTSSSSAYAFLISPSESYPQVAETYTSSGDSILGVTTTDDLNGFIAPYSGYSIDWYAGDDYITYQAQSSNTNLRTVTQSTFPAGIWEVIWSATGSEYFADGAGNTYTGSNSGTAISNYHMYIGQSNGAAATDTFTWARMRAYPPSDTMPTAAFGNLISALASPTAYSFQNKLVYSQGLWWAFYSDGTNIDYVTSPDGSVWSSPTIVTSSSDSTKGDDFSMWVKGSTIYYVLTAFGKSASFLWRYGTLQSSGTISWTISETSQSTTNTVYSYDSIVTDSTGNVWVALNTNDGTNTHIEVWRYSSSTWSKVDDISPLSSDEIAMLVPLSTGVALIYGEGSITAPVHIVTSATGSSWSSAISPPSDYLLFSSSATAILNTVYFAGLASSTSGQTTGTVNYWTFASGASSTSAETTIQSTVSGWSSSITEMPSKTFMLFYGSGSNVYEQSSENFGVTWSSATTLSSSETTVSGIVSADSSPGVMWTSGSTSPYNIRFAALPELSAINNSPFTVHMISLYILDTTSNTLTHYDTNSSGTDVTGSFDYEIAAGEPMSIPLANFAWSTSQNYVITVTTDQGVIFSSALTSPS